MLRKLTDLWSPYNYSCGLCIAFIWSQTIGGKRNGWREWLCLAAFMIKTLTSHAWSKRCSCGNSAGSPLRSTGKTWRRAMYNTLKMGLYLSISHFLKVMLTLLVTSASTEKANPTLKFSKTPLRSTLTDTFLSAFVFGYKHRHILESLCSDSTLVERFIYSKRRQLLLKSSCQNGF